MEGENNVEAPNVIIDLTEHFEDSYGDLLVELQSPEKVLQRIADRRLDLAERLQVLQASMGNRPLIFQDQWRAKMDRAFELVLVAAGYENVIQDRAQAHTEFAEPRLQPFEEVHRIEFAIRLKQIHRVELRLDEQLLTIQLNEQLRQLQQHGHIPWHF